MFVTGDAMKALHVTYREPPADRHPMQEFLEESDALETVQLWNWNLLDDVDCLLFRVEGDRDAYEDALAAVPWVRTYSVAPVGNGEFFAYVEHETRDPDVGFRAAFSGRRLVVAFPVEFTERGTELTVLGRPADLQAVLDDLPERADVTVDYVGSYPGPPSSADLTARQRDALAAAEAVGYYEVPREGSVADVAERLDCAPSTASNHLRKAEAALVRQTLGT